MKTVLLFTMTHRIKYLDIFITGTNITKKEYKTKVIENIQ